MSITEVEFQAASAEAVPEQAIEGKSQWQLTWRRLRSDRMAIASVITILVIAMLALLAPAFASLTGHSAVQQYPNTGLSASGRRSSR